MADPKLEALAKAYYALVRRGNEDIYPEWERMTPEFRMANHGQVVSWVLEVLGCKVCPAEGAIGKALEALELAMPLIYSRSGRVFMQTALRALRGEGGEE